jgi:hypothetical protein
LLVESEISEDHAKNGVTTAYQISATLNNNNITTYKSTLPINYKETPSSASR